MGKKSKNEFDFSDSQETRVCRLCGEAHKIGYATFVNKTSHLVMVCEKFNRNVYIPFESGLKIPSVLSKNAKRYNDQVKTDIYKYLVGRFKRSPITKIKPYAKTNLGWNLAKN